MDTTPSFSPSAEAESVSSNRVRNFLRVILALSFAGLFVAGALSISKLFNLGLPCGAAHGCDIVNNDASSKWFGVPVAYIGFGGYAIIAALAIVRAGMTAERSRPVALVAYLVSAFGALTSVALQVYSIGVIHATCRWCLTSAVLMIGLLVVHALEYGDRVSEDVPAGRGEFKLASVLAVVVAVALGVFGANLKKASFMETPVSEAQLLKAPLVPDGAHIYGDKASPVTIVEFADLMCPVCQKDSPLIKEFVAAHPGKVRLVYRHFPLSIHPMGMLSAAVSEAAADEGKFWDFSTAVAATGENMQTSDRVFEVARSVGLDPDKIKAKLADEKGPAMQRLIRDVNAGNALGLTMTPTFLVQVPGQGTEAYSFTTMMDELKSGRYKKYIDGP